MKTPFLPGFGLSGRRVNGGPPPPRRTSRRHAFSLIEMLGVLAVLALTAAMLLPILVKQTDSAVASQETATLQAITTALQNNIQRTGSIPSLTNWISVAATEMGTTSNYVALTVRNQPRLLLIDTNGFGSLTLPYVQTATGATNPLANSTPPRFLVVSSLGLALPTLVGTNGFPSLANFNALWNTASGTVPWNAQVWAGKASDVTIQRLDLAYAFAHLVLSNTDTNTGSYSINGSALVHLPPTNVLNAYFFINTPFNLYLANTNMEAAQVLLRDSSWVFSNGGWRGAAAPAPTVSVNGTNTTVTTVTVISTVPDDCGHQFCCQSFCTNQCCPNNTTVTPHQCCMDMTNYMNYYQQYANTGFKTNSVAHTNLLNCCTQLKADMHSLCNQ